MKWLVVSPYRSQLRMLISEIYRKWCVTLKPDLFQIDKFGSFEEIEIEIVYSHIVQVNQDYIGIFKGLMNWNKDSASVFSTELPICRHKSETFYTPWWSVDPTDDFVSR